MSARDIIKERLSVYLQDGHGSEIEATNEILAAIQEAGYVIIEQAQPQPIIGQIIIKMAADRRYEYVIFDGLMWLMFAEDNWPSIEKLGVSRLQFDFYRDQSLMTQPPPQSLAEYQVH